MQRSRRGPAWSSRVIRPVNTTASAYTTHTRSTAAGASPAAAPYSTCKSGTFVTNRTACRPVRYTWFNVHVSEGRCACEQPCRVFQCGHQQQTVRGRSDVMEFERRVKILCKLAMESRLASLMTWRRRRDLLRKGFIINRSTGLGPLARAGWDTALRVTDLGLSGLSYPTAIEFAPSGNGPVFIIEKAGKVKVLDNIGDTTPTQIFDVGPNCFSGHDDGLLGLAVHPSFPLQPYIYLLYTLDVGNKLADNCFGKCNTNGRLSRLTISSTNTVVGGEQVLLEGFWCAEYSTHTIGDLVFGADGYLYVTAGDGGNWGGVDYGQFSTACGDQSMEGGALRSQDIRTPGDPVGYDGALLRVDPLTLAAAPNNALQTATRTPAFTDAEKRIIAHGLRNPFRMTARPNTNPAEIWIADVGWNDWEEINVVRSPTSALPNFGWPCYEGLNRQGGYDGVNANLCETLYSGNSAPSTYTPPFFTYQHGSPPSGDNCRTTSGSAVSGLAFYQGNRFPTSYRGALIFGDYSVGCVWAMLPGPDGNPNPASIRPLISSLGPIDMLMGPDAQYACPFGGPRIYNPKPFTTWQVSGDPDELRVLPCSGIGMGRRPQSENSWILWPSGRARSKWPKTFRIVLEYTCMENVVLAAVLNNEKCQRQEECSRDREDSKVGQSITYKGETAPASLQTWFLLMYHCTSSWPGLGLVDDDQFCHVHPLGQFDGRKNLDFYSVER
eukprot:jgi/Mesvir1/10911/Mv09828-RA.1